MTLVSLFSLSPIEVVRQALDSDLDEFWYPHMCYFMRGGQKFYFLQMRNSFDNSRIRCPEAETIAEAHRRARHYLDTCVYRQSSLSFFFDRFSYTSNSGMLSDLKNVAVTTALFYQLYQLKAHYSSYILLLARESDTICGIYQQLLPLLLRIVQARPPSSSSSESSEDGDVDLFRIPISTPESDHDLFAAFVESVASVEDAYDTGSGSSFSSTPAPLLRFPSDDPSIEVTRHSLSGPDFSRINVSIFSHLAVLVSFATALLYLPDLKVSSFVEKFESIQSAVNAHPIHNLIGLGKIILDAFRYVFTEIGYVNWPGATFFDAFTYRPRFTQRCRDVHICWSNVSDYSLDDAPHLPLKTLAHFKSEVASLILEARTFKISGTNSCQIMRTELEKLLAIQLHLDSVDFKSRLRAAPFSVCIHGPSSIGKSSIVQLLYRLVGMQLDLPLAPGNMYVWNGNSKYYDGCRSDQWCFLGDDIGRESAKVLTAETSTTRFIIDVCNNTPFTPAMADVTEKGRITVSPKLMLCTTNNKYLNAHTTNACPAALLRRFNWYLTARPIQSLSQDGRLDNVAAQHFQENLSPTQSVGHMWQWQVEVPEINENPGNPVLGAQVVFRGVLAYPIDPSVSNFDAFLELLSEAIPKHTAVQQCILKSNADITRNIHFCRSCKCFACVCPPSDVPISEVKRQALSLPRFFELRELVSSVFSCVHTLRSRSTCVFLRLSQKIRWVLAPPSFRELFLAQFTTFVRQVYGDNFFDFYPQDFVSYNQAHTDRDAVAILAGLYRCNVSFANGASVGVMSRFPTFHCSLNHPGSGRVDVQSYMRNQIAPLDPWSICYPSVSVVHLIYHYGFSLSYFALWFALWWLAPLWISSGSGFLLVTVASLLSYDWCHRSWQRYVVTPVSIRWIDRVRTSGVPWLSNLARVYLYEHRYYVLSAFLVLVAVGGLGAKLMARFFAHPRVTPHAKDDMPEAPKPASWWASPMAPLLKVASVSPSSTSAAAGSANSVDIQRRVANNTLYCVAHFKDGKVNGFHALSICDDYVVLNRHSLFKDDSLANSLRFYSVHPTSNLLSLLAECAPCTYREIADDVILLKLLNPLHKKSILDYLIQRSHTSSAPAQRYTYEGEDGARPRSGAIASLVTATTSALVRVPGDSFAGVSWSNDVWRSTSSSTFGAPGFCGAPYVAAENFGTAIVGIHGAGGVSAAVDICLPVFREDVLDAISGMNADCVRVCTHFDCDIEGFDLPSVPHSKVLSILPLHKNSLLRSVESQNILPLGSSSYVSFCRRSKVTYHITKSFWNEKGVTCDKVPPVFNREPWKLALAEFESVRGLFDIGVMTQCVRHYEQQCYTRLNALRVDWKKYLGSFSIDEAADGIDSMDYVDHVNYNTSMGFPWYCSKSEFMLKGVIPDFVRSRVDSIFGRYKLNKRAFPVFCSHLKDEAISPEKLVIGKIRVFVGSPIDFTLAIRMRFLSFVRLFQKFRFCFESGVSIAAQKTDWADLYDYFGPRSYFVGGDYKAYDKGMHQFVTRCAFVIVINICVASERFSPSEINDMYGMMEDIVNPIVEFRGDLARFFVGNPSGHPLTVVVNCIANSLYIRYAFLKKHGSFDLFDDLRLVTYGDDNLFAQGSPNFSHCDLQDQLADLGIIYTMPDKSSVSRPYLTTDEIEFLKRKFTEIIFNGTRVVLAPLELKSIFKILIISSKSAVVSSMDLAASSLITARNELFFHGRDVYNQYIGLFQLCATTYCLPYKHCDWEEYFPLCYPTLFGSYLSDIDFTSERGPDRVLVAPHGVNLEIDHCTGTWVVPCCKPPAQFLNFVEAVEEDVVNLPTTLDPTASSGADEIGPLSQFFSRPALIKTINISEGGTLNYQLFPWRDYMSLPIVSDKARNFGKWKANLRLKFVINATPFQYGAFLFSYKPLTGNYTPTSALFWPTTPVGGEIHNETRDISGGYIDDSIMGVNDIVKQSAMIQRPHVWLYPQISNSAEMVLPFAWPNDFVVATTQTRGREEWIGLGKIDMLSIIPLSTAAAASANPITISIFANLENVELCAPTLQRQVDEYDAVHPVSSTATLVASAAAKLSTIPIIGAYATAASWFAGKVSTVASWFGWSNTINIGPIEPVKYVMATRWADTEVHAPIPKLALDPKNELSIDGGVGGFSRSDDLVISSIVKRPFLCAVSSWANNAAPGTIIQSGFVTPSHFQAKDWTVSSLGGEVALAGLTPKSVQFSPAYWISQAFEFWRGDMVLDFTVLCSKFHRGRLRFVFDPMGKFTNFSEVGVFTRVIDLASETSFRITIPYQGISPFLRTLEYQKSLSMSNILATGSVATFGTTDLDYFAGYFQLMVLTDLSAPTDANATIVTSVSWKNLEFMCPVNPYRPTTNSSSVKLMTQLPPVTVLRQAAEIDPLSVEMEVVPGPHRDNKVPLVCGGETVKSLRQLLHRWSPAPFCTSNELTVRMNSYSTLSAIFSRFPDFTGTCPAGKQVVNTNIQYNVGCESLLNYFSTAFAARRGGIMWRFIPNVRNTGIELNNWRFNPMLTTSSISKALAYPQPVFNAVVNTAADTALTVASKYNRFIGGIESANGMEMAPSRFQILEACIPDYNPRRFRSNNPNILARNTLPATTGINPTLSPYYDILDAYDVSFKYACPPGAQYTTVNSTTILDLERYCCSAPDYTLMMFLNVPTFYVDNAYPTP